jgi:hypothetical protein
LQSETALADLASPRPRQHRLLNLPKPTPKKPEDILAQLNLVAPPVHRSRSMGQGKVQPARAG